MQSVMSKRGAAKWIVATVVTPLFVSMCLANVYIAYWYSQTGHEGPPPPDVIFRGSMYMAGPGLWLTVYLWWRLNRKRHGLAELFAIRTSSAWKDLALGIALGGLWVVADGLMGTPPFAEMFRLDAAKLISVPTSLSAGLCEEFLFRGSVFLVIARAGGNATAQIIWSSLAFGAAHFAWGPYGMLFTFLLGLTLGAVRHLRGGVWSAVAAHSILNLCIEPGLMEWALQARS